MSKINSVVGLVLIAAVGNAGAITNADLARLNNELIGLDAQLAVAKKREELSKYTGSPAPHASSPSLQPPITQTSPIKNSVRQKDQDGVSILAIHGDPRNLTADFDVDRKVVSRSKGEPLANGWTVGLITVNSAQIVRSDGPIRSVVLKLNHPTALPNPSINAGERQSAHDGFGATMKSSDD